MLHLLDPRSYPLDSEAAFRKRVADRQALAEIVAALTPENSLYLDSALDQLAEMFPDEGDVDFVKALKVFSGKGDGAPVAAAS